MAGKRSNGQGALYKQADGRWVGAIVLTDGKRRRYYGKRKADVEDRLNRALERQRGGLPVVSASGTVATFLVEWLAAIKPSVRANTFERYEQYVRLYAIPVLGRFALPSYSRNTFSSSTRSAWSPAHRRPRLPTSTPCCIGRSDRRPNGT